MNNDTTILAFASLHMDTFIVMHDLVFYEILNYISVGCHVKNVE
jgi:hypothetical protein